MRLPHTLHTLRQTPPPSARMNAETLHHNRPWFWVISTGIVTAALVLLLQVQHGFYASDLGGDPDEPAHAVTSLMVRDYLATSLGENPLTFANAYYARFPKIALGHYPPMYYLIAGVWLLPFRNVASLGVLQALQIGLLAATTVWLLRHRLPLWAGALIALAWSLTPFVLKLSVLVMSDLQLALLCLWSAMAWARFLDTPKLGWSLAFGCLAAAAILTKASAWSLALLPGLSLVFTQRWALLRSWRLWAATLPVLVFALPWQLWSSKITARGMTGMTPTQHVTAAVPFYAEALPRALGWSIITIIAVALLHRLIVVMRRQAITSDAAVLWSLMIATMVIVLTIPAGLTSRYLMPLFFPTLIVTIIELHGLATSLAHKYRQSPMTLQLALLVVVSSLTIAGMPGRYDKQVVGFGSALTHIVTHNGAGQAVRLLTDSDARGEGALVVAAAFHAGSGDQHLAVLRASKELASQDWMGRDYKLRANTPAETLHLLDQRNVNWVILDMSLPRESRTLDHAVLQEAMHVANSGWVQQPDQPVTRALGHTGVLELFHRQWDVPSSQFSQHVQPTSVSLH